MKRLVIFDCDGTLVDGQAAICDTMDEAFAAARLSSPDRNEVRRMVGLSLPQALRQLAPGATDDQRDIALDAYKSGYRDRRFKGTLEEPLYDGMAELIDRLVDAGWLLAVATGKSDRGLHSCLDMHGIKHHFVSLQTADRHPSKPHPSMIEQALAEADVASDCAVMIGDTTFDIEMARAAGVRAIGVAWGYHEPSELLEAGAQGVAGTMQELEDMINAGA
ncbi:HAD-IA family hydrolase [Qipengyuania sp. NPDC077563]|uniref:HAD-IA family hydrolase n=1 Tax=Qipengyuania sp. NPDC077563 TaxID=3364497 RepID=UPI00384B026A